MRVADDHAEIDNTVTPQQPCFDYQTLGDELDQARLSWRFYASKYGSPSSGDGGYWSSYQAVRHIYYGPDWKKRHLAELEVHHRRAQGKLANFTWITPVCDDSDHVNCPGGYGPSWVAALVNAVGKSKFWDSTAIFVQWDDWGGLYDHVPRRSRITTAWASAFRCSSSRRTPSTITFRTCSTRRRACCALPKISSGSVNLPRPTNARTLLQSIVSISRRKPRRVREDRGAATSEVLHPAVRTIPSPRLRIVRSCHDDKLRSLRVNCGAQRRSRNGTEKAGLQNGIVFTSQRASPLY